MLRSRLIVERLCRTLLMKPYSSPEHFPSM
jgi:hypothetical protein